MTPGSACPAAQAREGEAGRGIGTGGFTRRQELAADVEEHRLPPVWPSEAVETMLAGVDRSSSQGKRDYAILLLAAPGAAGAQPSLPANVGDNANIIPIYQSTDPPAPDDYLRGNLLGQRCNEASIGISSINPDHMMVFCNDYRATFNWDDSLVPSGKTATDLPFLIRPGAQSSANNSHRESGRSPWETQKYLSCLPV